MSGQSMRGNSRCEHECATSLFQKYLDVPLLEMIRAAAALAILLAGTSARVNAQTGIIRGHVVRADLPVGLAGAHLELRPAGARTRTDARGFFVFEGISPGQAEVAVRRVGFAPAVVVLQVGALAVTEVDIPLEPVPTALDP